MTRYIILSEDEISELRNNREVRIYIDDGIETFLMSKRRRNEVKDTFRPIHNDIFKEFLTETKLNKDLIVDYRPCSDTDNAIVVWLKGGSQITFKPKGVHND